MIGLTVKHIHCSAMGNVIFARKAWLLLARLGFADGEQARPKVERL